MTRHLVLALGLAVALAGVARPALAQDDYEYQGQAGGWDGAPEAYPPDEGGAQVDVNVDMGAPGAAVSFETFRDGLAPYGEWVSVGSYGRVWRPTHVAAGWRPYYYGRWEWTDEGWLWVSEENWGWATYHYGRWAYEPYYGWVWVPGYQWAPAWVTWRYSPDYIGWAPLAPGYSVYVSSYPYASSWWSFVPCQRFVGVPVYSVAYTGPYVRNIYRGTQPAPPRAAVYGAVAPAWGGPARPFVEHRIGHTIAPVRVQPVGTPAAVAAAPARGGVVHVFRPEVRPAGSGRPTVAAPSRPWGSPAAGAAPSRAGASAWRGAQAPAPRPVPQVGPRQYAPTPHQYSPGPRQQYVPAPRQQHAPGQGGAPRQQSAPGQGGAPRQQYAPGQGGGYAPRPGGGPAPRGGGGGGGSGSGGHGAVPAPHRR